MTTAQIIALAIRMGSPVDIAIAIAPTIERECKRYAIPPEIVLGVIARESRFNPNAKGKHGEIGLAQILPRTALLHSKKPIPGACAGDTLKMPAKNAACAVRILARCRDVCSSDNPADYLGAYNGLRCGKTLYGARILMEIKKARGPSSVEKHAQGFEESKAAREARIDREAEYRETQTQEK